MPEQVRTTQRSYDAVLREADPEFEKKKREVPVYTWSNGRTFYDRLDPYSGTST